jgi:SAM-dependent methyltransferase
MTTSLSQHLPVPDVQGLTLNEICPSCGANHVRPFFRTQPMPVHSVLLLETHEEAMNYPKGDIVLCFCDSCGFVYNAAFDGSLQEYSEKYEATQSCSPTFSAFARQQAEDLIARYDLHGKRIIEIGCGQGEFISELCELGGNTGIGFDPAYRPAPLPAALEGRLRFVSDFYSELYADISADLVCCKMTLEHIDQTAAFVSTVRRALDHQPDAVVFFQVPNAATVFKDVAYWDVYYEHCSYFTPGSLARLFRHCGFEVLDLRTVYDDQYITIETRPSRQPSQAPHPAEEPVKGVAQMVELFVTGYNEQIAAWTDTVRSLIHSGKRLVVWGGSSKGVTFLNTLQLYEEVPYVVDINPKKQGTYMAGTGQETILPEQLKSYGPDAVVIMNPIYREEITRDLHSMGLYPEILTV